VLERLGFTVIVPDRPHCCGRPLYDWGMLDSAERLWRRTMTDLRPEIEAGTPVVGLEPACVSSFRDELSGLFAQDPLAERLSRQTSFFTEFIDCNAPDAPLPLIERSALVQIHCHHHSIIKPQSEQRVLERLGLDYEFLPSGCCGIGGIVRVRVGKIRGVDDGSRACAAAEGARGAFGYSPACQRI
jgi:Fe-S oxidoreductase